MKKITILLLVCIFIIISIMPVCALEIVSISTKAKITDIIGGKAITFVVTEASLLPMIFGSQNAEEKQINCEVSYEITGAITKTGVISTDEELVLDKEGSYDIQAQFTGLLFTADKSYKYNNYSETITIEKLSAPEIMYDGEYVSITLDEDADIYYSINETASEQSTLYDGEFEIQSDDETVTITAIAVKDGYVTSDISKKDITMKKETDKAETQCRICGEKIAINEVLYNEDLICQDCYNELKKVEEAEEEIEKMLCQYCEERFEITDDIYNTNGDIICPYCDENLTQENDNENTELECPHCGEYFEDSEDVYDSDGYVICPYCDECIEDMEEITEESEFEFLTSEWAIEEVYEAYQNNLIPDEMLEEVMYTSITREEFAAVAVKLYEYITGETPYVKLADTPFTDCSYTSRYADYIGVAYKLGITNGISKTTFSPYNNISREQLATMLYRVIRLVAYEGIYDFDVNNVRKFYDDSQISDYAKESVYFMAENGIVKGMDGAHFVPLDTATKEQAILISLRCINSFLEN